MIKIIIGDRLSFPVYLLKKNILTKAYKKRDLYSCYAQLLKIHLFNVRKARLPFSLHSEISMEHLILKKQF